MAVDEIARTDEYRSLIDDYKDTCLWSAADCYHPTDKCQVDYLLRSIETYGDMSAFKRAGRIRQWL